MKPFIALALLPLTASLSGDPLTPKQSAAIDAIFAESITPQSPGCGVALIRGGSIVQFKGYGLTDVERRIPWTPQSVFHPGSIYKQFFAAGMEMLAREGKLSLDDDVRKYLPEIPDYGSRITVRDLLTHTHGLREYHDLLELAPVSVNDDKEMLRLMGDQRAPASPPRKKFNYGNTGPQLAAMIAKRVSGVSAAQYVAPRILEPLEMKSTSFGNDGRETPPNVPGYQRQNDGSFEARTGGSNRITLEDLARWNQQFDTADAEWQAIMRRLTTPATLDDGTVLDAGMSLRLRPYRGLRRVWSPGAARGFRAIFMRFPDVPLTIAMGCNRDDLDPIRIAEAIADVVLADKLQRVTPARVRLTKQQRRAFVGTYISQADVVRVIERNGSLYLVSDGKEFEMVPAGGGRFVFPGKPVVLRDAAVDLQFRPRGHFDLHTVWEPAEFTEIQPVDPRAVRPADYVGTYASQELQSTLEVLNSKDGLLLKTPRGQFALEPVAADLFRTASEGFQRTAGSQLVRFSRERGAVVAATVSRAYQLKIVFTRQPD